MDSEYDIIVVGAGGSGLAAAVSAAEHGARVLVLEKQPAAGGTTGIAVGSFTAAETTLQKRAGHLDRVEDHFEDVGKFAPPYIEALNNDSLREFFLRHASETLDWLVQMGITFHGPSPEPPNRVPRMHNVVPGAQSYISTLCARLKHLRGKLVVNAVVKSLRRSPDGRIIGVTVRCGGVLHDMIARRGVILAAGDYTAAADLISRFKGPEYAHVRGINPYSSGDGHRMVESVGGALRNMDITYGPELRFVVPERKSWPLGLPNGPLMNRLVRWMLPLVPPFIIHAMTRRILVTWQHPEVSLFEDGAILLNRDGLRFCNECQSPERELQVAAQSEGYAYILLNHELIQKYSCWPCFISTAPRIAYAYVRDYLQLRPDVAVRGTLNSVAQTRGLPEDVLARTAQDAFNAQEDDWVLLGPVRAWFTTTEGGAEISQQFEVLDTTGRAIPGLYAVGQNGLGGQILWGHGLHIAWAMTSGRLAGCHVAGLEIDRSPLP